MSAAEEKVTVIGLGPMGQAMARLFLTAGREVTVWNRTPSRADALVAEGVRRADTPSDALAASDLVVLSLTDYAAMDAILGGESAALAGRTLVNLSSDTPDATREAARWAQAHGAAFLTGGVMVPPPMLGGEDAYVYYSGPADAFASHEKTLGLLGTPRYVGEDPGAAQLLYQAHLDVFLTALSGIAHAVALVGTAGVSAVEFLPDALGTLATTNAMTGLSETGAAAFDDGVHPGDLSTATMMGATAAHILGASESAGIDTALPQAVLSYYERAIAAGHGTDGWTSIIEVMRPR
ncbi:NAD(P)-binding domain-containing protein [Mumia sp. zg.B21]|uniref:NAD(P)-dependent oxidoreductase n=1 Tax=Mumia sp. zg.B21 TaxID=2855447 RepID=UPI001C6EE6D3|nr:NAD(P)-binding domain-containing protein [Mumia sp. zg.B21]MBW9208615.1 NAD(P)-binding domain-containing protein [Mumia sp. zg.B21]